MKKLFYAFAFLLSTCSVFGDITFTGPSGGSSILIKAVSTTPPVNSFLLLSDSSFLLLSDGGKLIIN